MVEEQGINELAQLILTLEDASENLEQAYVNKDAEKLNQLKKFILEIQSKINDLLK
ncbi:MAG: hypothetical protein WC533_01060 [Candidatus Pacearchaeota archaeon]